MKKLLFWFSSTLILMTVLTIQSFAIQPTADFRSTTHIQDRIVEKMSTDIAEVEQAPGEDEIAQAVADVQEILNLDHLDRENTMKEALRQENLEDRIRGNEDLELAISEKNVDVHLGKVLKDMHGNRVRMEEYVMRPVDNQVQFLNLTMRDNRLDYINYNAFFNKALPTRTDGYWRKEFGLIRPEIYLTKETVEYSNLQDSINQSVSYFEPTWVSETHQYVLPEKESAVHVNNILKIGFTRDTPSVNFQEMEGAVGVASIEAEFVDQNLLAKKTKLIFRDGTYLQLEKFLISEDGDVRQLRWNSTDDFIYWMQHLDQLVFNSYSEMIWTASEFEGRTIDVVSQFLHLVDIFENEDN